MLKESIYHEEIIVQNVYASNNRFKIHDKTQKKSEFFVASNYNHSWKFQHPSFNNKLINWMLLKRKTSALSKYTVREVNGKSEWEKIFATRVFNKALFQLSRKTNNPDHKIGKRTEQTFTKADIQIANKDVMLNILEKCKLPPP